MQAARAAAARGTRRSFPTIGDRLRAEIHFRFLTATSTGSLECPFPFRFPAFPPPR